MYKILMQCALQTNTLTASLLQFALSVDETAWRSFEIRPPAIKPFDLQDPSLSMALTTVHFELKSWPDNEYNGFIDWLKSDDMPDFQLQSENPGQAAAFRFNDQKFFFWREE